MIELPEAINLSNQLSGALVGKTIGNVYMNKSPHKLVWFFGEPEAYHGRLTEKTIGGVFAYGGIVEIHADDMRISVNDGVNLRYFHQGEKLPPKHQIQVEFTDFSSLIGSVQMYGGILSYREGENNDNMYYTWAKQKPSPLSEHFDDVYFKSLYRDEDAKLSAKAYLATKQRIPGLGNGVLHDILFNAHIHPRRKMNTLSETEYMEMFRSVKQTLFDMTAKGGRDTEKDLYGCKGGYSTILSSKALEKPCPVCGGTITREAYLGGNIYYCATCQPL